MSESGSTQGEKPLLSEMPVVTDKCASLNGIYQNYGKGVIRRSTNGRGYPEGYLIQKISFNGALDTAGTWTGIYIKGVQIIFISEKRTYEVKLLGSRLKEGAQMNEVAMRYELPMSCSNGQWVYHKHIAGAGEGVTTVDDSAYYLVKNPDGSLHINQVSNVTTTELSFKRHVETSTDYSFAPL